MKILMLHGYTQSGPLFRSKTRAVEKHLQRHFPSAELIYPTAPIRLVPADLPSSTPPPPPTTTSEQEQQNNNTNDNYAWWRRDDHSGVYNHLETSLAYLAGVLATQGPFTGVIGFSQGGAMAAMIASLLEDGRREGFERRRLQQHPQGMEYPASFIAAAAAAADNGDGHGDDGLIHPPLKFAVVYSGFVAGHPKYAAFYDDPGIRTPILHFIGSLDTVVEEGRSLALVRACCKGGGERDGRGKTETETTIRTDSTTRLVYHPGGHFLPAQKPYLNCLVGFLRDVLEEEEEEGNRDSKI